MKLFILLITLLISTIVLADVPGFENNTLVRSKMSGYLRVTCHGRDGGSANFLCGGLHVEPDTYSYFYGPTGIEANKVKIVSTWENGKVVEKTRRYSSKKSRTRSHINLAINTITQRALLGLGKNQLNYSLINDGEVVAEGEFEVGFIEGNARTCRPDHIISYNGNDCRFRSSICQDYFRRQNYCK